MFYGRLGEVLGREIEVEVPTGRYTISDLRQVLAQAHPHSAAELTRSSLRACVADKIVGEDFGLADVGTVEFFPPLSGG